MLSSTSPTTSAGLSPPSPKPHPLQAAPHPPLPPNPTCSGAPGLYKEQEQSTYPSGWMDGPWAILKPSSGSSGPGKRSRTPGRGWSWPLSMVAAYRGGVGVTEKEPASRDIPWRQHKPAHTAVGTGAGPRLPGDKPAQGWDQSMRPTPQANSSWGCGLEMLTAPGHLWAIATHGSTQPSALHPTLGRRCLSPALSPMHERAFVSREKNGCEDRAEYPSLPREEVYAL